MRLILMVVFLAGCASYSGSSLVPGQATADEVEKLMGPSAEQRPGPGGETVRYYPRLPNGRQTFAARIDANGRLVAIEQRLTVENMEKMVRGDWNAARVRDLLGPPWEIHALARQEREVWTYPMEGTTFPKHLYVQFSPDRVLREVIYVDDPTLRQNEDNH